MNDTARHSALGHADVAALLAEDNTAPWIYLDVRTALEFATGHVPGAFNIPYQHGDVAGLHLNEAFTHIVTSTFSTGTRLILGCRSGARAASAERLLVGAGFTHTRVHLGSLAGSRDAFGQLQPGWVALGYPVSVTPMAGRTYAELMTAQHDGNTTRSPEQLP